jgi:hypothetical protein
VSAVVEPAKIDTGGQQKLPGSLIYFLTGISNFAAVTSLAPKSNMQSITNS